MDKKPSSLPILIRFARPWTLLVGSLFYGLGAGIVKYLGLPISWQRFWLGFGMVILLLLSSYLLKAYFDQIEAESPLRRMQKVIPDEDRQAMQRIPKQGMLILSITTLTAGAVLTVIQLVNGALNLAALLILGIAFGCAFFYAVPPLRLVNSGYGDLVESLIMASLIPALSFLFQTGELHRLLLVFALPLFALYMAMRISLALQTYARDLKLARKNFLIILGWQRAMTIHNLLIPASYLLLILGGLTGVPWSLTLPALLTIPLAAFQIWQMVQIAAGAKPGWRLLNLSSAALVGLTIYFITLALWTN